MSDAHGDMAMAGAGGCREVQCIMGNGFPRGLTNMRENITFRNSLVGGEKYTKEIVR